MIIVSNRGNRSPGHKNEFQHYEKTHHPIKAGKIQLQL